MPAENVTVSATFKEKAIAGNKKIEVSQVSINKDLWEVTGNSLLKMLKIM